MDILSIIIYTVFYMGLLWVAFELGRWFERHF
jgi:hypothetical protein